MDFISGVSDLTVFILVQLIIETMAIAVRLNPNIRGIPIEESELKVSLLVNDSTCFWMALKVSYDNLLATLIKFSNFSGHKINFSKSDAIWIGAKKGVSKLFLFQIWVSLRK